MRFIRGPFARRCWLDRAVDLIRRGEYSLKMPRLLYNSVLLMTALFCLRPFHARPEPEAFCGDALAPEPVASLHEALLMSGVSPRVMRWLAGEPPVAVAHPWPQAGDGETVSTFELLRQLPAKYALRNLLRGGPIAQPAWFAALAIDKTHGKEGERFGSSIDDLSTPKVFARRQDILEPHGFALKVVKELMADAFPADGYVVKPNHGASGRGLIFINAAEKGTLRLTMANNPDKPEFFAATQRIKEFLEERRLAFIFPEPDSDLMHFELLASGGRISDVLEAILLMNSFGMRVFGPAFDPGIAETVISYFRPEGYAYETRHVFAGNMDSVQEIGKYSGADAWFARFGSSGVFSNQARRKGPAREAYGDEVFAALYESDLFPGLAERRAHFEIFVEALLRAEYHYLIARLRRGGIAENLRLRGSFDLVWQKPQRRSAFPVPVLMETHLALSPPPGPVSATFTLRPALSQRSRRVSRAA
jgi:hypothetical protein